MPDDLVESQKLPEPIFTPSTKAGPGEHDENISPEKGENPFPFHLLTFHLILPAATLVGQELYDQLSSVALKLYSTAAEYALTRGLILVDTKFEFGLIPDEQDNSKKNLILIDEALTPDSSRYWSLESYKAGGTQSSFDKQFLRDWLVQSGFKKGLESGPVGREGEGWVIEESVVEGTRKRYAEAVRLLMA